MARAFRPALAFLAALLLAASAAGTASADLGGFVIRDYHSELWVEPDAGLRVEERIEIDFSQSRHGIYRNIPVRYTDPRGFAYSIDLRFLGVEDENGRAYDTKVSNKGQYVEIRIGDADRTVIGRQVYVIRYHVRGALAHLSEHDELYWNAIGDEWFTDIDSASATVHLPAGIDASAIVPGAWSGAYGSSQADVSIAAEDAEAIDFALERSLGPRESMTVRVAWPHGYVDFPSELDKWLRRLGNNWIILAPLAALAWLSRRYRSRGKDPEGPGSVTVRYEPPEGVRPGEIGTIVDEKVDLVDITATVVDLAVRGHLSIGVEEASGFLRKREISTFQRKPGADASTLCAYEQATLDGLFESGSSVTSDDLKEQFYQHLPAIKTQLYAKMTEDGLFSANPESVRTSYYGGGFLAGLVVFGLGMAWAWWRGILMPYALIAPGIGGLLTAVAFFGFAGAMPSRTRKGVGLQDWALGFQDFVNRVESDRLERAEAQNVFETLLPYAMALGVAATWAGKFEGIYDEAGPSWYVGPQYPGHFSTRSFESSLSTGMAATAATMAQAPRSSGSGGGGFSGGGFGGGGGGSW